MYKPVEFESCLSKAAAGIVLSPAKRLQAHNLAQWFDLAIDATRFCSLCGWPLDDFIGPDGHILTTEARCVVCVNMETALVRNQYWRDLEQKEKNARRNMGLD